MLTQWYGLLYWLPHPSGSQGPFEADGHLTKKTFTYFLILPVVGYPALEDWMGELTVHTGHAAKEKEARGTLPLAV